MPADDEDRLSPIRGVRPRTSASAVRFLAGLMSAGALGIGGALTGCSGGTDLPRLAAYDPRTAPEERIDDLSLGRRYVADPLTGIRPRRGGAYEIPVVSLATARREVLSIEHDEWGFVGTGYAVPTGLDGEPAPDRPRVLVVGDDDLDATVPPGVHVARMIRDRLRGAQRFASAEVGNAACASYGLPHHLLRTHAMAAAFAPDVVVVVVAAGNDFLETVDARGPRIAPDGSVIGFDASKPSTVDAVTDALSGTLDIPRGDRGLVRRGLAQASELGQRARRDAIRRRTRAILDLFEQLAGERGFELVFAVTPSFDMAFPDKIARLGTAAQQLVESGAQTDMVRWFEDELTRRGLPFVDLLEEFRWIGPVDLFTADFLLHTAAHRRLAESVMPLVRDRLDAVQGS